MAPPDDAKDVLLALRLGWSIAEVRGRNRPDAPPGAGASMPADDLDHALPLQIERTPDELRIEAQAVLMDLAGQLGVDTDASKQSYSTAVDEMAKALHEAPEPETADPSPDPAGLAPDPAGLAPDPADPSVAHEADLAPAWSALAEHLWKFDAHIQDALAGISVTEAAAYQLGRGMAETYWALDPSEAQGVTGWTFLLGDDRCNELSRLTGRLGAYFDTYTPSAAVGSIEVWRKVAADPNWRGHEGQASTDLYRQIRRWYELLILGQDPTTLVKPGQVVRNFRTIGRAIKFFWVQMLALVGGVVAMGFLGDLLAANSSSTAGKVAAGVLGAVGLSLASITGFLKNTAQAMLKRLRQDAYTDLIAVAVQTAPSRPGKWSNSVMRRASTNKAVREAISNRLVTPQTPN